MSNKMFTLFACRRKRIYFLFLCIVLCFAYLFVSFTSKDVTNLKTCFIPTLNHYNENITLFEDILEATKKPIPDRSVFFIETSCRRSGLATLTAR